MGKTVLIVICLLLAFTAQIYAVPTLQVYIDGATAGDMGQDEDTWFQSGSGAFNLVLVGAYGPKTQSITNCVLVASVPQGEQGTISVNGATLIKTNADADILTDVAGNDGYTDKSFLPANANFNEHFPFKSDISDFVTFDVDSFANAGAIHNYDADSGTITTEGSGQEKTFATTITGFSSVHFDLYGYVTDSKGQTELVSTWDINPGSHDSTWQQGNNNHVVPVPGALLLATLGTSIVGYCRRKRMA